MTAAAACPQPFWHETHRYCPVCDWTEQRSEQDAPALSFAALRETNVRRCLDAFKQSLDDWSLLEWAGAAAGEVGELANLCKKLRRGEDVPLREIGYEAADAVIYLDLLCAAAGIDLGAMVREKFNVVSDRRGSEVRL